MLKSGDTIDPLFISGRVRPYRINISMKKFVALLTLILSCFGLVCAVPTSFAQGSPRKNTAAGYQLQMVDSPSDYSATSLSSSISSTALDSITQVQVEAMLNHDEGNVLSEKHDDLAGNWAQRVTVSGQLNVDGKWRTKNGPIGDTPYDSAAPSLFQQGHYNDIYLNNSQIDVDAWVSNWTQAHISLTGRDAIEINRRYRTDVGDNAPVNLDEAYMTIGNLDKSPLYATVGRQYVPFGVYERHALTPTLTQYLTQTQATAAKVGFALPMGLYGSAYAFRGQFFQTILVRVPSLTNATPHVNNFGGELGLHNKTIIDDSPLTYHLSVGYLEDLGDVDWIAYWAGGGTSGISTGAHDVPAISVDGTLGSGVFALHGGYVQSLSHFRTDGSIRGSLDNAILRALNNNKPWAFTFSGDYNFDLMGHDSTFSLNYQRSGQIYGLGLPKARYGGSYKLKLLKDTSLMFDLFEDQNFSNLGYAFLGYSSFATQANLRLSVDF